MKAINEGKFTGSLLLDLSAGFDVINFEILLKKLEIMVSELILLLGLYLYGRKKAMCEGQVSLLAILTNPV